MKAFTSHRGIAAPLLRINVDTDAIIPSREMKTVGKRGLADGLFAGWRYSNQQGREPDPDFVLNQPQYRGATIHGRDVAVDELGAAGARRIDLCRGAGAVLAFPVGDDEVRALLCQRDCGNPAHATRAAGDQHDLAVHGELR